MYRLVREAYPFEHNLILTYLEESEGFEPSELLHPTVFKTVALNRSANSPYKCEIFFSASLPSHWAPLLLPRRAWYPFKIPNGGTGGIRTLARANPTNGLANHPLIATWVPFHKTAALTAVAFISLLQLRLKHPVQLPNHASGELPFLPSLKDFQ